MNEASGEGCWRKTAFLRRTTRHYEDVLRVVIVDDERLSRLSLRSLLENEAGVEVAGEAGSAAEALEIMRATRPDALFLDVQMPGESGFDLVGKITGTLPIVFVSTSEAHALRAFEVNALDYLHKPVAAERLHEAVRRLRERGEERRSLRNFGSKIGDEDLAFLPLEAGQIFLRADSLLCIESVRNYSRVTALDQRQFVVRKSLNAWEEILDAACFFRINRNVIVRVRAIDRLEDGGAKLYLRQREGALEVSRRRAAELKALLKKLSGESGNISL